MGDVSEQGPADPLRVGERWFMQHLVHGELVANSGGWQWSEGTGPDAAPCFRIFNPVTQGRKLNPEVQSVGTWVRELAGLPAEDIHAPWEDAARFKALNYCGRVVLHEGQRSRCRAL